MRTLDRYLLRNLLVPFALALAATTGLMLLNQVGKQFPRLVGKGLGGGVITEVFVLSVPFILAMTLPMAVLVAVLYAFTRLALESELTAFRAGGIGTLRILAPALAFGAAALVANFLVLDWLLPVTNARLRNLLLDIGRKQPTFKLEEQVVNPIRGSPYFLRASRINAGTGVLREVTIYEVSNEGQRRVIVADSGLIAATAGGRDLAMLLFDGTMQELQRRTPADFQVARFDQAQVLFKGVLDSLERSRDFVPRSDREMRTCELLAIVDTGARQLAESRRDRAALATRDLRALLGLPPRAPPPVRWPASRRPPYCRWQRTAADSAGGTAVMGAAAPLPPRPPAAGLSNYAEYSVTVGRGEDGLRSMSRYGVEAHKKWAISAACVTFVLVGLPIALRFPRGGLGLVIGAAMALFTLYYIGLTAGESLADRGLVRAPVAMWASNALLLAVAAALFWRLHREPGTARDDPFGDLAAWLRRLGPRRRAAA